MMVMKRRTILRYICFAVVFMIILFITYAHYYIENDKCQDQDMKQLLNDLCSIYRKGEISGNLCVPLCEKEEFHYVKCLNYREGKITIFGHWNGEQVVLKTKHARLPYRENLGYMSSSGENEIMPSSSDFLGMLRSSINSAFGINPIPDDEKLLSRLWHSDLKHPVEVFMKDRAPHSEGYPIQRSMMKSLWSLVQQDEYLFLKYFSDNQFLPNIFGSCGHVYAMEYAPSTGVLEPTIFQWSGTHSFSWSERADIARKLLDLVKSTEADYQEPLHMCDIKGGNFGIANNGVVKPIDLDTVFFRSKLKETFENSVCNTDKDCDFFDCKAICDIKNGKCYPKIMNNNLQAICTKIFSKSSQNMLTGLLKSPPAAHKARIEQSINKCKNLVGDELEHTDEVFQELKQNLANSVK